MQKCDTFKSPNKLHTKRNTEPPSNDISTIMPLKMTRVIDCLGGSTASAPAFFGELADVVLVGAPRSKVPVPVASTAPVDVAAPPDNPVAVKCIAPVCVCFAAPLAVADAPGIDDAALISRISSVVELKLVAAIPT